MQKMSKHSWAGALVLIIALWCVAPMPVNAIPFTPAVEYTSTGSDAEFDPFTLGYQFSTSDLYVVDALAYWDDGLGNDHQVGLWDSGGNLMTSTTVLGLDLLQDHFRYHPVVAFTLSPGIYTIGGEFLGGSNAFPRDAIGVGTYPGFTWIQDRQVIGAGLHYPTDTFGTYGQYGILIPNFSIAFAGPAPVPEPSTVLLLASGLVGIFGYAWRRKGAA